MFLASGRLRKTSKQARAKKSAAALLSAAFDNDGDGDGDAESADGADKPKTNLLQSKSPALGAKSYNSRSGQIFGILGEMKDEFTRDHKKTIEQEKTAAENFEKLSKALKSELAAANQSKKDKEQALATANQRRQRRSRNSLIPKKLLAPTLSSCSNSRR